jgi:hypothetical protein
MTHAYGAPFITFGIGWPFGLWMDYDCDWGAGNLISGAIGYSRPANWWHESSRQRDMGHTGVWRSDYHPGAVAANRGDRGYGGNALSRRQLRRPYDKNWPTRQHRKLDTQLIVPAPRPRVAGRSMTLVANVQPAFPDPRPLPLNTPHPSAGRNQAARSQEYKVRPIRELTAIAASKVCRPSNDQHRFQDPHPFAASTSDAFWRWSASTVAVEAAIIQVSKSVNFYFHDFQKKLLPMKINLFTGLRRILPLRPAWSGSP